MKTKWFLFFVPLFMAVGLKAQQVKNAYGISPSLIAGTATAALSVSINSVTNEPCNGDHSGTAKAWATGGSPPYTYAWTTLPVQTTATATGLSADTYTITVTDANELNASTTAIITQPLPIAAATTITNISCNGSNGSISVSVSGGTAPYAYAWAPSGGVASTANVSAGTYTVTISDINSCTFTASATITQPPALAVTVTGNQYVCTGMTDILTANVTGGTAPYGYTWSTGATTSTATIIPTSSGTYSVTVIDANGCPKTGQITVNVGTALSLTTSPDTTICGGALVTLCATTNGGSGGETYLWQPSNGTTNCINVIPKSTTTYTVTAKDQCGTSAEDSVTIQINATPLVAFSPNNTSPYICAPAAIQFYNACSITSGSISNYTWTFGNGDTLTTTSKSPPTAYYPFSGTYIVSLKATSNSGCQNTGYFFNLTIHSRPKAAFIYSPQNTSILEPTVQFTDKSTDSVGIAAWSWTFGDASDSMSSKRDPVHTYQDTGRFCPRLIATNKFGCQDTTSNCLIIEPSFSLYIPSSFSPNGDGLNDIFEPKGEYIKNFQMYIFNRWGETVYHTNSISEGWNGNMDNGSKNSPEGIYVYKIQVTDSEEKIHSYLGNVILIR